MAKRLFLESNKHCVRAVIYSAKGPDEKADAMRISTVCLNQGLNTCEGQSHRCDVLFIFDKPVQGGTELSQLFGSFAI